MLIMLEVRLRSRQQTQTKKGRICEC
jgi:hypothetical protein